MMNDEKKKGDEKTRALLLQQINFVLRNSVQLDHEIMELEARREALRVETLKMNDLLQQPSSLHYLHQKHHNNNNNNNSNNNNSNNNNNNNRNNSSDNNNDKDKSKGTASKNKKEDKDKDKTDKENNNKKKTKCPTRTPIANNNYEKGPRMEEALDSKSTTALPSTIITRSDNSSENDENESSSKTPSSTTAINITETNLTQKQPTPSPSPKENVEVMITTKATIAKTTTELTRTMTTTTTTTTEKPNTSTLVPSPSLTSSDIVDPVEESIVCGVCDNGDNEENNLIIICEGCSLSVHQACYGVQKIPDEDWFCDACKRKLPYHARTCVLCPLSMGAMKPTIEKKWVHVLCTLWAEKAFFVNAKTMKPVGGCNEAITREQKRLRKPNQQQICGVCKINMGCTVKCKYCPYRFHATCGRNSNFTLNIDIGKDGLLWNAICPNH